MYICTLCTVALSIPLLQVPGPASIGIFPYTVLLFSWRLLFRLGRGRILPFPHASELASGLNVCTSITICALLSEKWVAFRECTKFLVLRSLLSILAFILDQISGVRNGCYRYWLLFCFSNGFLCCPSPFLEKKKKMELEAGKLVVWLSLLLFTHWMPKICWARRGLVVRALDLSPKSVGLAKSHNTLYV